MKKETKEEKPAEEVKEKKTEEKGTPVKPSIIRKHGLRESAQVLME